VATELPFKLLVARAVAPSLNVTLPAGVPAPGEAALTVAVNVTDWPRTVGLVEESTAVVVLSLLTVWLALGEVLVAKVLSPPYTAVIEWVPTLSELMLNVPCPELRPTLPSVVAPSLNVTVPVGVPVPGADAVTVAVKLTVWPNTEGSGDQLTDVLVLSWFTVWVSVEDMFVLKLASPE
jgi:hypothetical protein